MRRLKGAAIAVSVGVLAAACGGSSHNSSNTTPTSGGTTGATSAPSSASSSGGTATGAHKQGGTVTISNEAGQNWTCQFNPFNPAVNSLSVGFVYEPLVYVNSLKAGAETPMLASSYKWSDDKKSITFTIRDGVKWNDGQPMTADDVAFTFNLMKQNSALDLYSLWTGAGLQSVAASGSQVTMTFA
ncbi:MAG TPA: ABC transporter substrate-binding protein, partial [Acidothermaceae bacterium]|nr:ABC transporter substrate-binding protein [Acidothermaceae bacterium]